MKKISFFLFLFLSFLLLLYSCTCKKRLPSEIETISEQKMDFAAEGYLKATVIYYEVDACKYVLQLEDAKKLEPVNLKEEFKKDQLPVWIKYLPKKNTVSICMAGTIVELTDIQLRK